jgi:hypothetical protein
VAGLAVAAIAVSIAAASVVGRYHYTLDAAAGLLVGIAAWALVATGAVPAW